MNRTVYLVHNDLFPLKSKGVKLEALMKRCTHTEVGGDRSQSPVLLEYCVSKHVLVRRAMSLCCDGLLSKKRIKAVASSILLFSLCSRGAALGII